MPPAAVSKQTIYRPWADTGLSLGNLVATPPVDPSLFVTPKLADNAVTVNRSVLRSYSDIIDIALDLSLNNEMDIEGYPTGGLVHEILRDLNEALTVINNRVTANTFSMFKFRRAVPPADAFPIKPIRYPCRSNFGLDVLFYFMGCLVELAELNNNGLHSGMDPDAGYVVMGPLLYVKQNIMIDYFEIEPAGHSTLAELRGIQAPGTTGGIRQVTNPGATAPRPAAADIEATEAGTNVLEWFPTREDMAKFEELRSKAITERRSYQPEEAVTIDEDSVVTETNVVTAASGNAGQGGPGASATGNVNPLAS